MTAGFRMNQDPEEIAAAYVSWDREKR